MKINRKAVIFGIKGYQLSCKEKQFFKKTKDNESIKSLDIFFRLYLMNKGFNVLKEGLNKLTDSNRIKDSYNVLN